MPRSSSFTLLAALLAITCAAPFVRADDKADIITSGKAFAEAMRSGDLAAVKKYSVHDEKMEKALEAMTKIMSANKNLTDSAVAKFGEEGKSVGFPMQNNLAAKDFEEANIEVNGDTANVTGSNGHPVTFKKEGGLWKIDLSSNSGIQNSERMQAMSGKLVTAMNETATEIKDGKYMTAHDAQLALFQKFGAMAGGRPGGPGAGGRP